MRNSHCNGACRSNCPRRCISLLPKNHGAADQQDWQNPGQSHQRQTKPRRNYAKFQRPISEYIHRLQRNFIFISSMSKQFNGFDIGDRINYLPGDHGAGTGSRGGIHPDPRHEKLDQPNIGHQPNRQCQCNPVIYCHQIDNRSNHRCQCEKHCVDNFGRHIRRSPCRLHLLGRDPAGKIIVEKGYRLPQGPTVQTA